MNPLDHPYLLTLYLLYLGAVFGMIYSLIRENRDPIKTALWILIIWLLPILGALAYLIFGQDIRRIARINRRYYRRLRFKPQALAIPKGRGQIPQGLDPYHSLMNLIHRSAETMPLPMEDVEIFVQGKEMYDKLFEDIAMAQKHVHLQAYIFEEDSLLDRLEELVLRKRAEGVSVRIIYDYLGSYEVSESRWERMRRVGVEIFPFLKVQIPLLSTTVNYRNHRKVAVIDGIIGYIGGMNFADRYQSGNEIGAWRDTHFRLKGNAVAGLQASFVSDWYSVSRRVVNVERFLLDEPRDLSAQSARYIQFIYGGPIDKWRSIEQAYVKMIVEARRSVRIQTPYLLPTVALHEAIIATSLAGVQVEIMIPRWGDSRLTNAGANSYLESLLEAGVKIFRYEGGFLHSKLMMIDGAISCIGSANMDFRSLEHNFEIVSIAYDSKLTQRLENIFDKDKEVCSQLNYEIWQTRPWSAKLMESVVRLFSPLL